MGQGASGRVSASVAIIGGGTCPAFDGLSAFPFVLVEKRDGWNRGMTQP